MGLNLETLIGILVILILLIVADGLRRVLRDRSGRLKVRIDPRFKDHGEEDNEDFNPELPSGSARVVQTEVASGNVAAPDATAVEPTAASQPEESQPEPSIGDISGIDEGGPSGAPPVVMEKARGNVTPPRTETQQDLFSQPAEAPAAKPESVKAEQREAAPAQDLLEVIVIHLVAASGQSFPGRDLLSGLLEQGMRYGEMHIFHNHQPGERGDELQFSMANAVEPGTFDIDRMEKETFRGVTFFLKLPGPGQPMAALDRMLKVSRRLADTLGGELKDEQRSVLTPQTAEHLRQRVQDFERRQRLARGH